MKRAIRWLLFAISACVSWLAYAQDFGHITRTDVAGSRPQLAYDPAVLRLGSFTAMPSLRITGGADDNIFAQARDTRTASFYTIEPAVTVASDWGRHFISADLSGKLSRYPTFPFQNSNEYAAKLNGRYDADANTTISPHFEFSRNVDRRTLNGYLNQGTFSIDHELDTGLLGRRDFGRFSLAASGTYTRVTYDDLILRSELKNHPDSRESQTFRDTRSLGGAARLSYDLGPAVALVLTYRDAKLTSIHPSACCIRDSSVRSVTGGVIVNPGGLIDAEVHAGYLRQRFKNPGYSNFGGFTYDVRIGWYPTELVTVRLTAGRDLHNSGILDVGTVEADTATAHVDYELLRNLLLTAKISLEKDKYREIRTNTRLFDGELNADYTMNRHLVLGAFFDHQKRTSSDRRILSEFSGEQAGLSMTLHP